jgi:hypothetical protein
LQPASGRRASTSQRAVRARRLAIESDEALKAR